MNWISAVAGISVASSGIISPIVQSDLGSEKPEISEVSREIVEETAASSDMPSIEDEKTVEDEVRSRFADKPALIHIAKCESSFRQFDNSGNPLRGIVNKSDIGVMQINLYYHGEDAKLLGYDLFTLEGNLLYAEHLYEMQGTSPWVHSKPCWSRYM